MSEDLTERIRQLLGNQAMSGYQGISGAGDYEYVYDMIGDGNGDEYGEGDVPLDPRRFARSYLINVNPNASGIEIRKAYGERILRSSLSQVKKQALIKKSQRINLKSAGLNQKPHHVKKQKKVRNIPEALEQGLAKYNEFISARVAEGHSRKEALELWRIYKAENMPYEGPLHEEPRITVPGELIEREPLMYEYQEEPVYKQITTREPTLSQARQHDDRQKLKQDLTDIAKRLYHIASNIEFLE